MLEPWASKSLEQDLSLKCQSSYKHYHCNTCDTCAYNIKWLHTVDTEKRELVHNHIVTRTTYHSLCVSNAILITILVSIIGVVVYACIR
jgi:hypothetical protein